MTRNLIVLSDGTGNSAAKAFKTNVWRLYQALDLSREDQIAVFGDGVGTSSFRPLQVLGLALGVGVRRNVLHLYKFLCRNYPENPTDDDKTATRIYAFGFSRGAFTIRVLNGLICSEGLVTSRSEEELDRNARAAYRNYRRKAYPAPWFGVAWIRKLRNGIITAWRKANNVRLHHHIVKETFRRNRRHIPVHFLGVWDTVSAYGLPIDELTTAVDKWIWPMKFREQDLPPNVEWARHALSLDDERRTFFPVVWNERKLPPRNFGAAVHDTKLLQVWFAGVHANVGGGYPDDSLSHVPLCWMIREAEARGLRFQPWTVSGYRAVASDCGPIYDSRSGGGALYRYQPRDVDLLMNSARSKEEKAAGMSAKADEHRSVVPLVDCSVILRMAEGNDGYVPISLPERIDILTPDGRSVPFDDDGLMFLPKPPATLQSTAPNTLPPARDERLATAIALLTPGRERDNRVERLKLALDTVWWRRIVYFITLFIALTLVAYPLFGGYIRSSAIEFGNTLASGSVAALIGVVRGILPGFAAPWLDAVAEWPVAAILLGIGLLVFLSLSRWLQVRIRDRARAAWSVRAGKDIDRLNERRRDGQKRMAARAALLFLVAAAFLSWLGRYETADREATGIPELRWALWAIAGLCALAWLVMWARDRWTLPALPESWDRPDSWASRMPLAPSVSALYRRVSAPTEPNAPGVLLWVARRFRLSRPMRALYYALAQFVFPAAVLIGAGFLALMAVNRAAFDVWSTVGQVCKPPSPRTGGNTFTIDSVCWASGLTLEAGVHYRIWLEPPADHDWFDHTVHTSVEGFRESDSKLRDLFTLTKRSWSRHWFKPIARIGRFGNDEYVLHPLDPLPQPPSRTDGKREPEVPAPESTFLPITERDAKAATQERWKGAPPRILTAEITPRSSGELFLYVNDSVVGFPGLFDLFYGNNRGEATVTVERITAPLPRARR
jgi:uncharacterized protein (DUF2235 family)